MARLLQTAEVADTLGVAFQTAVNWRTQRRGPRFMKAANGRVIYSADEVERFAATYKNPFNKKGDL